MADTEINIKLNGIAQIKAELRELKSQLDTATDPEQMAELAKKAGELSDRLKDANERVAVFASGSPFEQTNNALGLMGSQLASLDFEGASESAKLFASAAKGINGDQIATQLKGLGGVVGNLGKGFMSLGATILTNPIFLIAGAVTALVVAIGALLNKFGLLKPIVQAIGKAFDALMSVIDGVVQGIKDFLDWMGLTNFAAEESAAKQVKALEKVDAARENQINKVTKQYDLQIRLAQIDGKNTVDLERKKQEAILATAQARYKDMLQMIENAKASGDYSDEEISKMREKAKSLRETAQNARNEIKIINAQEAADNRKKNEEKEKQDQESYKKRVEQAKQFQADRLAIARQIRDLELDVMEDGKDKELAILTEKYKRLIEDTQKNEKILSDEKKRLIALYTEEQFQAQRDIELKYAQQEEAEMQASLLSRAEKEKERQAALDAIWQENQQKRAEQDQKDKDEDLKREEAYAEAKKNLAGELVKGLQGIQTLLEAAGIKSAGIQKTLALVQIATDTAKSISSVIAGATAAASASGAAAPFVLAGYIAAGIGQVLGAIGQAWAVLKKAPPIGGAVSGSAPTASAATSTGQAATPQVNLFGQNNNANNLSAPQAMESTQNIMVKAVVSETEITNTQNKIQKITQAATL